MIIAVTAWRDWTDPMFIKSHLIAWRGPYPLHIRVGDAPGGDAAVRQWCEGLGVSHRVFYADWNQYGNAAGPIRNREMLEGKGDPLSGPTDLLLAFPGRRRPVKVPGSGSWGCCIEAALMGIRVEIPAYKEKR